MIVILSLDIGGANTKYALLKKERGEERLITHGSIYFPFWQKNKEYPKLLRQIRTTIETNFGEITKVVFVTTAELADCFTTKKEGIKAISDYMLEVFADKEPEILDFAGKFIPAENATDCWEQVAATNWYASAMFLGSRYSNAILLDIGSTTTDIIPIHNRKVVAQGRTDLERLATSELVYTGLLRTNVIAILSQVKIDEKITRLSSELFATTADVYLLLDKISPKEFFVETADGKPFTKEHAKARLARVVCADTNQLTEEEILGIARQVQTEQYKIIRDALEKVRKRYQKNFRCEPTIVLIGAGATTIGLPILNQLKIKNGLIAKEELAEEALNCFSAYALGMLAIQINTPKEMGK